jgi:hypothetical protein
VSASSIALGLLVCDHHPYIPARTHACIRVNNLILVIVVRVARVGLEGGERGQALELRGVLNHRGASHLYAGHQVEAKEGITCELS